MSSKLAFTSILLLAGCVEQTTELTAAQRDQLRQFVGTQATSPQNELDISFENKIKLIGYDLDGEVRPGGAFTITWHWKVDEALDEGWRLFTHVADAAGENRINADGNGVIRELYQPSRWKVGEYVRDAQRVELPQDWNSPQVQFYIGVWNGPHRLRIVRGPNDGDNRARAASLDVVGAAAAPEGPAPAPQAAPLPALRAMKANEPIRADGETAEGPWGRTPWTEVFVNTMDGSPAQPNARVRALWDDLNVYFAFEVEDTSLRSEFQNRDDHLWEQDAVEIMIDPDGDGQNYFEIQVSPRGKTFETRYDTRRQPQPFGHVDWNPAIQAGVKLAGTVDDPAADTRYTVEIAIPVSAFNVGDTAATVAANTIWRVNFYVMDLQDGDAGQRAVGWSPPRVGDFHVPDRFGRLAFFDPMAPPQIRIPENALRRIGEGDLNVGLAGPDRPAPGETPPTRENPGPQ